MNHIKHYTDFIAESVGINDIYESKMSLDAIKKDQNTNDVDTNIKEIVKIIKEAGIKDENSIIGLLSVIGKESGFTPIRETTKYLPDNENAIRKIFGALTDYAGDIVNLKKKREKDFYNLVYGPDSKAGKNLGNTKDTDGYDYRGGGYTQLTGRKYYEAMGINNPKDIETPQGAAKALKNSITSYIGANPGALKFKTPQEAVKYFVNKVRGGSSTFQTQYDKAIKTLNLYFNKNGKFVLPK